MNVFTAVCASECEETYLLNKSNIYFIKYSARPITVSNTTRCCNLTFLLLVFIYICLLE